MDKTELIKSLKAWDTDKVVVFNSSTGQYFEIKNVVRGMGQGIILEVA